MVVVRSLPAATNMSLFAPACTIEFASETFGALFSRGGLKSERSFRVHILSDAIERAVRKKKNIVYVKPIWAIVMFVIKAIPEAIFKRMRI